MSGGGLDMTFDGIITAIIFVIGYVVSLIIHHVKMSHEFQFIKGQLSFLIRAVEEMDKVKAVVTELHVKVDRIKYDVDNAHSKIRKLGGE